MTWKTDLCSPCNVGTVGVIKQPFLHEARLTRAQLLSKPSCAAHSWSPSPLDLIMGSLLPCKTHIGDLKFTNTA